LIKPEFFWFKVFPKSTCLSAFPGKQGIARVAAKHADSCSVRALHANAASPGPVDSVAT